MSFTLLVWNYIIKLTGLSLKLLMAFVIMLSMEKKIVSLFSFLIYCSGQYFYHDTKRTGKNELNIINVVSDLFLCVTPLNMVSPIGFLLMFSIKLMKRPLPFSLLRVFVMNWYWVC